MCPRPGGGGLSEAVKSTWVKGRLWSPATRGPWGQGVGSPGRVGWDPDEGTGRKGLPPQVKPLTGVSSYHFFKFCLLLSSVPPRVCVHGLSHHRDPQRELVCTSWGSRSCECVRKGISPGLVLCEVRCRFQPGIRTLGHSSPMCHCVGLSLLVSWRCLPRRQWIHACAPTVRL